MDSVNVSRVLLYWVSPFGNLRIKAHLRLPEAYRSLSRPSSALSAKAFPLRPLQLDLVAICSVLSAIPLRNCLKALRNVSSQISIRLRWVRNLFGYDLAVLLQELGKSRLNLAIFVVD